MAQRPGRKGVSLWPREHGIYAEVAFPMLTVFLLGGVSLAGVLFATCVVAAFLAHEGIMILGGRRGARVQREWAGRAKTHVFRLGILFGAAGIGGVLSLDPALRSNTLLALLPLLPLGALLAPLVWRGEDKTPAGETLVALMLAFVAVPIALAGGLSWQAGTAIAAAWGLTFLLATASVHLVLLRHKKRQSDTQLQRTRRMLWGFAILCSALLGVTGMLMASGLTVALAAAPVTLACLGVMATGAGPKHLRRIGWTMVATNFATAAVLLATL